MIVPYSNLEPNEPHVVLHSGGDIRSSYPVKVLLLKAITGSPLFEKCGFLGLTEAMKNANGEAFYQDCTDLPYQGAGLSRARLASSYPIHEERDFTLRQQYFRRHVRTVGNAPRPIINEVTRRSQTETENTGRFTPDH